MARPIVFVLIALGVTAFFAYYIKDFKLDASSESLVLEDDEDLKYYGETRELFGSDDYVVMTVTPEGDLFSEETLEQLTQLRDEFVGMENVGSVQSILTVPLFLSPPVGLFALLSGTGWKTLEMPETDRRLAARELVESPLYKDYLISIDGKTTAIQINFKPDAEFKEVDRHRYQLRTKQKNGELTKEERAELKEVEAVYKDMHVEITAARRRDIEFIREMMEKHSGIGELHIGGVPMIIADIINYVESDIFVFGIGVVIFALIMLSIIFRTLKWVVLPTLSCVLTALIMMGYLGFREWRTTVVTSNFTSLLLIVTMSMAIHIVVRFRELHAGNPDWSNRELTFRTVRLVALPCLYTSLTTIVGFGSLIVSRIRPVMDFGLMMAIGLSVAYLMCFLFLPAALLFFPKGKAPPAKLAKLTGSPLAVFGRVTERFPWLVALASVAAFVFFGFGAARLTVENRFIDYFRERTPIYKGMTVIDDRLGGTTPLEIVLKPVGEGKKVTKPEVIATTVAGEYSAAGKLKKIPIEAGTVVLTAAHLTANDDGNGRLIGDGISGTVDYETGAVEVTFEETVSGGTEIEVSEYSTYADYWFEMEHLGELRIIHEYLDSLPQTGKVISADTLVRILEGIAIGVPITTLLITQARDNLSEDIARSVLTPYVSPNYDQVRIAMRVRESSRDLNRKDLLTEIQRYFDNEGKLDSVEVRVTGMFVLYNNMLQSLFNSQIKTIAAVVVGIWLMFMILFRSPALATIAIIPNILPVVMVLGVLGWLKIPLDMMTIMIAAVTFGIAVDDTIHYIHRFQREFPKDRDYIATMYRCHNSIGRAMLFTSITIIFGFSVLSLSNFIPTIYFGLFTGMAMIMALLAAVTLLPMLLIAWKPLGRPNTPAAQES